MNPSFTDEITLAEQAENLGRMALTMGLIPSFVVRHFKNLAIAEAEALLNQLSVDER
jgi:hypothetical protein